MAAEAAHQRYAIAVHVGAGFHSQRNEQRYLQAMRRALEAARAVMQQARPSCTDAVVAAVRALEEDSVTNAGRGSNLTEAGTVECDASIMSCTSCDEVQFGAVGAAPGLRSPIALAASLARHSSGGALPHGRVPPMFLVGEGAREWATEHSPESVLRPDIAANWLITEAAKRRWKKYMSIVVEQKSASLPDKKPRLEASGATLPEALAAPQAAPARVSHREGLRCSKAGEEWDSGAAVSAGAGPWAHDVQAAEECAELRRDGDGEEDAMLDTVGAVCMDLASGSTAAGVSSGGIALKERWRPYLKRSLRIRVWDGFRWCASLQHPGRVGEAAVFGAGCWACQAGAAQAASSVSGVGELIMLNLLARASCEATLRGMRDSDSDPASALQQCLGALSRRSYASNTASRGSPWVYPKDAGVLLLCSQLCPENPPAETRRLRERRHKGDQDREEGGVGRNGALDLTNVGAEEADGAGESGNAVGAPQLVDLVACFTSHSFGVGFITSNCKEPTVQILRQDEGGQHQHQIQLAGWPCRL